MSVAASIILMVTRQWCYRYTHTTQCSEKLDEMLILFLVNWEFGLSCAFQCCVLFYCIRINGKEGRAFPEDRWILQTKVFKLHLFWCVCSLNSANKQVLKFLVLDYR